MSFCQSKLTAFLAAVNLNSAGMAHFFTVPCDFEILAFIVFLDKIVLLNTRTYVIPRKYLTGKFINHSINIWIDLVLRKSI